MVIKWGLRLWWDHGFLASFTVENPNEYYFHCGKNESVLAK